MIGSTSDTWPFIAGFGVRTYQVQIPANGLPHLFPANGLGTPTVLGHLWRGPSGVPGYQPQGSARYRSTSSRSQVQRTSQPSAGVFLYGVLPKGSARHDRGPVLQWYVTHLHEVFSHYIGAVLADPTRRFLPFWTSNNRTATSAGDRPGTSARGKGWRGGSLGGALTHGGCKLPHFRSART